MATIQVRIDDTLKEEAAALYDELGLDLSTAIRMFLKRSLIERGLPFRLSIAGEHKEETKLVYECNPIFNENKKTNMTLDYINKEIRLAREKCENKECNTM